MIKIKSNDFQEMRAEYKEYLRFHNFDTPWIDEYLSAFDKMVENEEQESIAALMTEIGVELV